MMVNKAKEYISSELMAHLYRSNADALMEENPEEKQRREEVLKMYETSKEALKIIGDINMNTHSEPPPPPHWVLLRGTSMCYFRKKHTLELHEFHGFR